MQEHLERLWGIRLTRLLLGGLEQSEAASVQSELACAEDVVLKLCTRNVITIRALSALKDYGIRLTPVLEERLHIEQERVQRGMDVIREVTQRCEDEHIRFVVIKTLDQYPDQGQDIDIYVDEDMTVHGPVFQKQMGGKVLRRSLCDRLAQKVNYKLPNGFVLEVHCTRLGQVGEHRRLGVEVLRQRRAISIAGVQTFVPPPESQLLLAVLQRIYRHFNFRICDVYNTARLVSEGGMRWELVEKMSRPVGIYPGTVLSLAWIRRLIAGLGFTYLTARFPALPRVGATDLDLVFHRGYFRFPIARVAPRVYVHEALTYLKQPSIASVSRLAALATISAVVGLNQRFVPTAQWTSRLW